MGFTGRRVAQTRSTSLIDMAGLLSPGRGRLTGSTAGQSVTKYTIATVPAVHRAWDFAASAVANLTMGVWRQEGVIPHRVTATPQAVLFAGVPNPLQSWWWYWYIVEMSLEARNNAYAWKTRNAGEQVSKLTALHPDQVIPGVTGEDLVYGVLFDGHMPQPTDVKGRGMVTVDSRTIHHVRGAGGMGELVPRTPIDRFRTSLGIALAKREYEASLYENGVMGGLGVTFPANVTPEQAKRWREIFDSEQAGVGNAGRTKVIGGGGQMAQIGMTQKDAQFIEAGMMTIRDVWHMTGVPDWVLGVEKKTESSSNTSEEDDMRWVHYGLETRLKRIEAALYADPDIFGAGSKDYPAFDTAEVIHPDSETADKIAHQQIQDGRMLVDEWRIPRGMGPLPGGVGMIPLNTPVGAAPNDMPAAPSK